MVDKFDDNNNSDSAEALYRHYQRNRAAAAEQQTTDSESDTADIATTNTEPTMAEDLYQHYQSSRLTQEHGLIDAIMQKIDEQSVISVLPQDDQPLISKNNPQIRPLDLQPGRVNEQAQIDTAAANSSSIFKRWFLPGMAAAILAAVLIPLLTDKGPGIDAVQATLPEALSTYAEQSVAYINATQSASFGFSDTTNAAHAAFNSGVIATDLHLLVHAEQSADVRAILRVLVNAHGSMADGDDSLIDQLKSNASGLDDAFAAGRSKLVLIEHLASIRSSLELMAKKSNQLDWYVAGTSVESVRVAAELALEISDVDPLKQVLLLARNTAQPVTDAPASGLLTQLKEADVTGPEEFVQTSEILDKARDIILLMQ